MLGEANFTIKEPLGPDLNITAAKLGPKAHVFAEVPLQIHLKEITQKISRVSIHVSIKPDLKLIRSKKHEKITTNK